MFRNTFILTLSLFFVAAFAVEHRRCRKIKSKSNNYCRTQVLNKTEEEPPLLDNHIPEEICSVIPHPKIIINPYKKLKKEEILHPKNITALCLRCGTCLAVADKVW